MSVTAEKKPNQAAIGQCKGCENHDHDLIHELSKRLDGPWRYDQHIANAEGRPDLQQFWREVKQQDQAIVKTLKEMIAREIKDGCV